MRPPAIGGWHADATMPRPIPNDSAANQSTRAQASEGVPSGRYERGPADLDDGVGGPDGIGATLDDMPRARLLQDTIVRLIQAVRTRFG